MDGGAGWMKVLKAAVFPLAGGVEMKDEDQLIFKAKQPSGTLRLTTPEWASPRGSALAVPHPPCSAHYSLPRPLPTDLPVQLQSPS